MPSYLNTQIDALTSGGGTINYPVSSTNIENYVLTTSGTITLSSSWTRNLIFHKILW